MRLLSLVLSGGFVADANLDSHNWPNCGKLWVVDIIDTF